MMHRSMCSDRWLPTSHQVMITSRLLLVAQWLRAAVRISCATLRQLSTCSLPDVSDVREGLVATKIAAHAADIAKGIPGGARPGYRMMRCAQTLRLGRDVRSALDPGQAARILRERAANERGIMHLMCGKMCAVRTVNTIMDGLVIDLGDEY